MCKVFVCVCVFFFLLLLVANCFLADQVGAVAIELLHDDALDLELLLAAGRERDSPAAGRASKQPSPQIAKSPSLRAQLAKSKWPRRDARGENKVEMFLLKQHSNPLRQRQSAQGRYEAWASSVLDSGSKVAN